MDIVNANSTSFTTVSFFDKSNVPTAPISATYAITNVTTDAVIQAATPIAGLAASVILTITAAQNAIALPTNYQELRRIDVISTYSDGSQLSSTYFYLVVNQDWGT